MSEAQDSFELFLKDLERHPLIESKEEELRLGRLAREGDQEARDRLINGNLRFAIHEAKRYRNRGLSLPQLVSAAVEGLIKAVDRFDPDRGVKVITYASDWLHQEITRELQVSARVVRHSGSQQDKNARVRKLLAEARAEGRELSVEEIMAQTGYTRPRVEEAMAPDPKVVSLDKPVGPDEDASPLGDLLGEHGSEDEEDEDEVREREEIVRHFINTYLDPRDQQIVLLYFGFHGVEGWVFEEISTVVGVCRERVRQLLGKALQTLEENGLEEALRTGRIPSDNQEAIP